MLPYIHFCVFLFCVLCIFVTPITQSPYKGRGGGVDCGEEKSRTVIKFTNRAECSYSTTAIIQSKFVRTVLSCQGSAPETSSF